MSKRIGTQIFAGIVCLLLLFSFASAHAASPKDFVPYLPDTIDGMEKSEDVVTMDAEKMGQGICVVTQEYGNELSLTIADGTMLPQLQKFEKMKQFTMENEKKVVKRVKIAGHEGGYEFYKQRKEGNLLVKLSDTRIVAIEAQDVEDVDELKSLMDDVPLSDIAAH